MKDNNVNEELSAQRKQTNNNLLCEICQNTKGEYKCLECPIFKILCQKCDSRIHSKEENIKHNRENINNSKYIIINNIIEKEKTDKKKEINPITNNYLEQMKRIYEQDRNIMINENNLLQQKIISNQNLNIHKINNLNNKLNEIKIKNENNISSMKDNNNYEIKQLVIDKDFEIKYLINNNKELEKINNELVIRLNENMEEYTKDQFNYNDILTELKYTLNNLKKENIDIKEYYEKKINFLIDNFNREKKNIINSYELNIEKVNNEYNVSKYKYIKYLNNRDRDIDNTVRYNEEEIGKLKEKVKKTREELNELKNRKDELIKINNDLIFENKNLNENSERLRKELKFETERKESEEKKSYETQSDFYKAKKYNKKLRKSARAKRSQSVKY